MCTWWIWRYYENKKFDAKIFKSIFKRKRSRICNDNWNWLALAIHQLDSWVFSIIGKIWPENLKSFFKRNRSRICHENWYPLTLAFQVLDSLVFFYRWSVLTTFSIDFWNEKKNGVWSRSIFSNSELSAKFDRNSWPSLAVDWLLKHDAATLLSDWLSSWRKQENFCHASEYVGAQWKLFFSIYLGKIFTHFCFLNIGKTVTRPCHISYTKHSWIGKYFLNEISTSFQHSNRLLIFFSGILVLS